MNPDKLDEVLELLDRIATALEGINHVLDMTTEGQADGDRWLFLVRESD